MTGKPPAAPVRLKHRLEAFAIRALAAFLVHLPESWIPAISRVAAALAFDVFRVRRRVALENLQCAFPDLDAPRRRRIARGAYAHMVFHFLDVAQRFRAGGKPLSLAIDVENESYLTELRERGRFIMFSSHLGNWEMLPTFFVSRGLETTILYKPMHNPLLDALFLKVRQIEGVDYISTRQPDREIWRGLSQAIHTGRLLGILGDQDAGRRGIFVPFFGRPASTATGPATLALRHQLPLLPVHCYHVSPGHVRIVIEEPIRPLPGGRTPENVETLTRLQTAAVERAIRRAPEQYFWLHQRWKTQPRDARSRRRREARKRP